MRRSALLLVFVTGMSVLGASCGSSSPGPSTSGGGSATAAIKANWETFFNGRTPASKKTELLQNGQQFASVIQSMASSPMATSTTVRVHGVTMHGSNRATVRYDILLGGNPALTNQTGVAVLEGGTWKVGDQSFCGLLQLQGSAPPTCGGASPSPS